MSWLDRIDSFFGSVADVAFGPDAPRPAASDDPSLPTHHRTMSKPLPTGTSASNLKLAAGVESALTECSRSKSPESLLVALQRLSESSQLKIRDDLMCGFLQTAATQLVHFVHSPHAPHGGTQMRRRTAAELIDVCGAVPGTSRSITTHALSSFLRALPALIRTDKHSESLNQLASSLVQVLQILLEHANSSGPAASGNQSRSMFEDEDADSSSFFVARKESHPAAASEPVDQPERLCAQLFPHLNQSSPLSFALCHLYVALLHLCRFPSTASELVRSNSLQALFQLLPESPSTALAQQQPSKDQQTLSPIMCAQYDITINLLRALASGADDLPVELSFMSPPATVSYCTSNANVTQYLHRHALLVKLILAMDAREQLGPQRIASIGCALRYFLAGETQSTSKSSARTSLLLDDFRTQLGYEALAAALTWMDDKLKADCSVDSFSSGFTDLLAVATALVFVGSTTMEQSCRQLLQAYSASALSASTSAAFSTYSGSNTPASNTPTEAPKRTHGMDRLRSFLGMTAEQPKAESNRLHQQAKESAAAYDPSSAMCIRNMDALTVLERVLIHSCANGNTSSQTASASIVALSTANALLVLLSQHPLNMPLLQAMRVIQSCIEALPTCAPDVQHVILKMIEYQVENTLDTADSELTALISLLQPQTVTTFSSSYSSNSLFPVPSSSVSHGSLRRSLQHSLSAAISSSSSLAPTPPYAASPRTSNGSGSRSPSIAAQTALQFFSTPVAVANTSKRQVWPGASLFRQVLSLLIRCLDRGDSEFKDILRRCGLIEQLLKHCQAVADFMKENDDLSPSVERPTLLQDESFALTIQTLRAMLDKNFENMKHFKQLNGRTCMLLLLKSDTHRIHSLKLLQLFCEDENISDLLIVLKDCKYLHIIQLDIMSTLCAMLSDGSIAKESWLQLCGFDAVLHVLSTLYGAFGEPLSLNSMEKPRQEAGGLVRTPSMLLSPTQILQLQQHILWPLVSISLRLLNEAVREHPLSRLHFWSEWCQFGELLCQTGLMKSDYVSDVLRMLLKLATETQIDADSPPQHLHVSQTQDDNALVQVQNTVIANPNAVLLLLSCLSRVSCQQTHTVLMKELLQLSTSACNKESLASVSAVQHFLDLFGSQWLSTNHIMRDISLQFVESVASHRISAGELRTLMTLMPNTLTESLLRIVGESRVLPHIEFSHSLGFACIDIPLLGKAGQRTSVWPVAPGVSLSCWFQIRALPAKRQQTKFEEPIGLSDRLLKMFSRSPVNTTPTGAEDPDSPLWLFEFNTTLGHCLLSACIVEGTMHVYSGNELYTTGSTSGASNQGVNALPETHSGCFDFQFNEKQWYHVVLVHERGRMMGSSAMSLYVDGKLQQTIKLSYPQLEKRGQLAVRGCIGTSQHRIKHSALQWWLGPCFLFNNCLSAAQVSQIAQKGPKYAGTFASTPKPADASNPQVKATTIDPSSILFAYHAHSHLPLSQLISTPINVASLNSQGNFSESMRSVMLLVGSTSPGVLIPNSSAPPITVQSTQSSKSDDSAWPAAFLCGGAVSIMPLHLSDAIRTIGGIAAMLPFVARASNANSFRQALTLIGALLFQNPKNMREMSRLHGYEMLSSLLAQRSSWIDMNIIDVVFAICEGRELVPGNSTQSAQLVYTEQTTESDGSMFVRHSIKQRSGEPSYTLIANNTAAKHLLLNFQTWRLCHIDMQTEVLRRLAHLCFLGPRVAEINTEPSKPIWFVSSFLSLNKSQKEAEVSSLSQFQDFFSHQRLRSMVSMFDTPEAPPILTHAGTIAELLTPTAARQNEQIDQTERDNDWMDDDTVADNAENTTSTTNNTATGADEQDDQDTQVSKALTVLNVRPDLLGMSSAWSEHVNEDEAFNVQRLKQINVWPALLLTLCDVKLGDSGDAAQQTALQQAWRELVQGLMLDGVSSYDLNTILAFLALGVAADESNTHSQAVLVSSDGGDTSTSSFSTAKSPTFASAARKPGFLFKSPLPAQQTTTTQVTGLRHSSVGLLSIQDSSSLLPSLCAELIDALSMAVLQGAQAPSDSHFSRIVRQLESIDLRWFSLFLVAHCEPAVVTAVFKLLSVLLSHSQTFAQRWMVRGGFDSMRSQISSLNLTHELGALLLALLFGVPADSVIRQGQWIQGDAFDVQTLISTFVPADCVVARPDLIGIILTLIGTDEPESQGSTEALSMLQYLHAACSFSITLRRALKAPSNLALLAAISAPLFRHAAEHSHVSSDVSVLALGREDSTASLMFGQPTQSATPEQPDDEQQTDEFALSNTSTRLLSRLILQSLLEDAEPLNMFEFTMNAYPLSLSQAGANRAVQLYQIRIVDDVMAELHSLLRDHADNFEIDVTLRLVAHAAGLIHWVLLQISAAQMDHWPPGTAVRLAQAACFVLRHADFVKKMLLHGGRSKGILHDTSLQALNAIGDGLNDVFDSIRRRATSLLDSDSNKRQSIAFADSVAPLLVSHGPTESLDLLQQTARATKFQQFVDVRLRRLVQRLSLYSMATCLEHPTSDHLPVFLATITEHGKDLFGPDSKPQHAQSFICLTLTFCHRLLSNPAVDPANIDHQAVLVFERFVDVLRCGAVLQRGWVQSIFNGCLNESQRQMYDVEGDASTDLFSELILPQLTNASPVPSAAVNNATNPTATTAEVDCTPFTNVSYSTFAKQLQSRGELLLSNLQRIAFKLTKLRFFPEFKAEALYSLGVQTLPEAQRLSKSQFNRISRKKVALQAAQQQALARALASKSRCLNRLRRKESDRQETLRQESVYNTNQVRQAWDRLLHEQPSVTHDWQDSFNKCGLDLDFGVVRFSSTNTSFLPRLLSAVKVSATDGLRSMASTAHAMLSLTDRQIERLNEESVFALLQLWWAARHQVDFTETPSRQRFRMLECSKDFYRTYQLEPRKVLLAIKRLVISALPDWQTVLRSNDESSGAISTSEHAPLTLIPEDPEGEAAAIDDLDSSLDDEHKSSNGDLGFVADHHDSDAEDTDADDDIVPTEPSEVFGDEPTSKYEKIARLLEPGDAVLPAFLFNCARIQGLDKHDGVVIGCKKHLYIIDQFIVNTDGVLVEDARAAEQIVRFEVSVGPRVSHAPADPTQDSSSSQPTDLSLRVDKLKVVKGVALPTVKKVSQCQKWSYQAIREMHKRRYQLQTVGIEFFHANGTNFLLVFNSSAQRDEVYDRIMQQHLSDEVKDASLSPVEREAMLASQAGDSATQLQVHLEAGRSALSAISATLSGSLSLSQALSSSLKRSVTQRWVDGEMSNFAYLMYLNTLAGRSYNDLTQYPVFPWVLRDFTSETLDLNDERVYRDLEKPMGAIGEARAREFQKRYETWDDETIPPFHYGTHYSSSAGVLYYLIRLEPFTKIALELQGGKFDHADRLFFSLAHAYNLSSQAGGMSDVKELTPEFYCTPEFLVNSNHWDLGETQRGLVVDDVQLPPWANGCAQRFIRLHRAALESPFVSANLHKWIDLIFGHKQRGQAAVDAQNVFYYMTYQGAVDVDSIVDPVEKQSTISQINNFGQTPLQLFTKPHAQRRVLPSTRATISSHPKLLTGKPVHRLSGGKVSSLFFHTSAQPDTVASPLSSPLASTLSTSLTATPSVPATTTSPDVAIISLPSASLLALAGSKGLIAPKFNKFLSWGFADRSLRVCILQPSVRYPTQGEPIAIHEQLHDNSQISCATVTDDGRTIVLGSHGAMLSIWRRHEVHKYRQLTFVGTLCQHTDEVTCLATSTSLRLLVSGGKDKQVLVWDLNRMQLVCRLSENAHTQPIAAVAIDAHHGEIVSAAGSDLFVWTVNGRALAHTHLDGAGSAILSVAVGKEPTGVIVTGHQDGSIRFFAVHYDHGRTRAEQTGASPENGARLLQLHCIEKAHSAPVTCLHTSAHDLTKLWTGDALGHVTQWTITPYVSHWVPEAELTECSACKAQFTTFVRRHHCRLCGKGFCHTCSSQSAPLPSFAMFSPVRVCDACFEMTSQ